MQAADAKHSRRRPTKSQKQNTPAPLEAEDVSLVGARVAGVVAGTGIVIAGMVVEGTVVEGTVVEGTVVEGTVVEGMVAGSVVTSCMGAWVVS